MSCEGGGRPFTVSSYNVHGCVGGDRHYDPVRVGEVLRELAADVIGLQEVDSRLTAERPHDQLDLLAAAAGLHAVAGPTIEDPNGRFGNALLTCLPVLEIRRHPLAIPGREPRGALDVDLGTSAVPTRVIVTHLGLGSGERRDQVELILRLVEGHEGGPLVLLGDFNEWMGVRHPVRRLRAQFGRVAAPRTFPARFPLLRLDRLWVRPKEKLSRVRTHRSPKSRWASDHLPVVGLVDP